MTDGVVVSDVARRHDISPSQLFGRMRQFRDAASSTMTLAEPPMLAPAVVDVAPSQSQTLAAPAEPPAAIEICVGVATVRIRGAVDGKMLATMLKALRVLT